MSNYQKTVSNSLSQKLGEIPSIIDFGCPIDGTSDCSLAINTAIVQVSATGGGTLKIPGGYNYTINSPILFSAQTSGTVVSTGTKAHTITSGSIDTTGRLLKSPITIDSIVYTIDTITDSTHFTTLEVVPAGTVTYIIQGQKNITFVGDGATSRILRGADMLDSSGNGTVGMVDISSVNITLKDIAFFGLVFPAQGVNYSTIATSTPAYDPMQEILTKNTTIWIKGSGNASGTTIQGCHFSSTGGYCIAIDARFGDVSNVVIKDCKFINNSPHLFGTDNADLNYGSWTGGIHYQGDGTNYSLDKLLVTGCTFSFSCGNQIWGHAYAFDKLHSNITVTNNTFSDIGRDCIELGNTSVGLVEHNMGRRIGYVNPGSGSTATPKYLPNQYAVFIDTTGTSNVIYNANTCVSVYGAFIDGDGFAYGAITNNVCRQPISSDPEYTEDSVSTWADNYAYGCQIANNYFQPGGTNVNIMGNSFINCKQGGIRLFSSIGCHVADNIITCPADAAFPPVMLGNFIPAGGGAETHTYNTDIVNNNIQWNPATAAAAIQEMENWSGTPILWLSDEKNWIADNKMFGNCFEFSKAPSSSSVTGTLLSSQADSITSTGHALISRKQSAGVNYTSFDDASGNTTLKYDDTGQMMLTAPASSDAFHRVSGSAGKNRGVAMHTGDTIRWALQADSAAESGSNSGSDFSINRYDDSGSLIDTPFLISRDTGVVTAGSIATVTKFFDSFADQFSGTCTTVAGTGGTCAVTWVSGAEFTPDMVAANFTFNDSLYTIHTVVDNHHLTLNEDAGTQGPLTFYIGNAFQTSTGTMGITSGGWGLFQEVVATKTFNSKADIYGGNAFQTSSGNCFINGDGSAGFQSVALNFLDIAGTPFTPAGPPASTARLAFVTSDNTLRFNNGSGWVSINNAAPGSNTEVIFNNSGVFGTSTDLTFSGTVLTVGSPSGGVVASLFNSSAIGSNLAFSATSGSGAVNIYANGQISGSVFTLTTGAPPTTAFGSTYLYSDTSSLRVNINGLSSFLPVALIPSSSNNQVMYSNGTSLVGSSTLTYSGGVLTLIGGAGTGVIASLFNSTAIGTALAFSAGGAVNIYANGQISGSWFTLTNQGSAPTAVTGSAYMYATSSALWVSVNTAGTGGYLPVGLVPASSSNRVMYSNGTSLQSSANFTFASNTLTVGSGAATGVIAPLFNASSTGTDLCFQGASGNFSVNGNAVVATNGSYKFGPTTSVPTSAVGFAYLYFTGGQLMAAINGNTAVSLSGGGLPAGSNTQVQFNNSGSFGASANLTWSGTFLTAPEFAATAIGSAICFQGTGSNFLVDGNGNVTSSASMSAKYHVFINGTAPTQGSGFAYMYSDTSGVNLAIGTGSFSRIATQAWVTSQGYLTSVTLTAGTGISVSGLTITNSGVTSFNGSTGAITLSAAMVATAVGQALTSSSSPTFSIVFADFHGTYTNNAGSATIDSSGNIAGQSCAVTTNFSTVSGIYVCQGNSGYTGPVAGRNAVGGIVV